MTDVIKFIPKAPTSEQAMQRYRDECAKTGELASPFKAESGDPNTITTADGDVLFTGQPIDPSDLPASEFGKLDLDALFNIREWVRSALESKGAKVIGSGIGVGGTMGIADVQIEIDGCQCNIEIRPLPRS